MLSFYITAVKYNYLTIEKVPAAYQTEVKKALGMEDPVEEVVLEPTAPAESEEEPAVAPEENTTEEQPTEA